MHTSKGTSRQQGVGMRWPSAVLFAARAFLTTVTAGNDPEMNSCESARAYIVNEGGHDTSRPLNVDRMKQLNDNTGSLTTTGKYVDPSGWTPMGRLWFATQDAPKLPMHDGGLRSRLMYM